MSLEQEFVLQAMLHGLTAVFWLVNALSAFTSYRAFRQTTDVWWTGAFIALALVQVGNSTLARNLASNVSVQGVSEFDVLQTSAYFGVRTAGIEMLAALAILYVYRARRTSF
jgi:hypothetical protein